jgi:hypothetical protein
MSLASIVSSFYPITFGSIQDMARSKLASEGGPRTSHFHVPCNF